MYIQGGWGNCLPNDQLEKKPVRGVLDFNESCTQKKNVNLQSFPLKMWFWFGVRQPFHLFFFRILQISTIRLDNVSDITTLLAIDFRVLSFQVATPSLVGSLLDLSRWPHPA